MDAACDPPNLPDVREHDAASRRMVVVAGGVLAAALAAVAAAAWTVLRLERESGRDAARRELRAVLDRAGLLLADADPAFPAIATDAAFRPRVAETAAFDVAPPVEDPDARFWLAEAGRLGSPALTRAALRAALASDDAGARLQAAHRLREPTAVPDELRGTREGVALWLAAGDAAAAERAWRAVGSEDDVEACALLVGTTGGDPVDVTRRLLAARARAADVRRLLSAAPHLAESDLSALGGGRLRSAILEDGAFACATPEDGGWRLVLCPAPWVAARIQAVLAGSGVRIVSETTPEARAAVAIPVAIGRVAVRDGTLPRSPLTAPLLAGLAVVGGASIVAFLAFVRAVGRERRAAAARAEFVATVSHELRTPVAVVRTSAETLLAGRAVRDEDRNALLAAIVRETERLSSLLGNVLDFARMDAGTQRHAFRDVDVGSLVEEAVRRTAPSLAAGGFRIDLARSGELGTLRGDPDALAAALANLFDNAAKYRGASDAATLRVVGAPDSVSFEVEDRGIGVPDADKPHVFERFFRGSGVPVRATRGAGIGLALVRHTVDAHGGAVSVGDTPGGGATFRLDLPRTAPGRREEAP